MAGGFVKNAHRIDPYKNYKFRVVMDGRTVLGISKVSALKKTTEVVKWREGGENSIDHKSPGRTTYEPVTLERGITHDIEFENWANTIYPFSGDAGKDLVNYQKDITLEMMNEKGHVVLRYFLHKCWVSEFTALPELDANANAVAIESVKFELEGWERDTDTKEPDESSDVPMSG